MLSTKQVLTELIGHTDLICWNLKCSLVSPQGQLLALDAILSNYLQGDPITSVDLTLSSRDEDIVDNIDRLLHAHGSLVYTLHVLQANLVVEKWLQKRDSTASCLYPHLSEWPTGS